MIEEMRSVSRKMKPRRYLELVVVAFVGIEELAARYSSTLCCEPRGLFGSYQARVGRCVAGNRWMWESIIGVGIAAGMVVSWMCCCDCGDAGLRFLTSEGVL